MVPSAGVAPFVAKSSLVVANASLVAHSSSCYGHGARRLHRRCSDGVDGRSAGASPSRLRLVDDMRATWWASRGQHVESHPSPSSLFSLFNPSQKYSTLPRFAAESGREGPSEDALGVLSKNQENELPGDRQEEGASSNADSESQSAAASIPEFNIEDDGGMECIGTGSDVECVVPLKSLDSKVQGKFAGRAVNENLAGKEEGEGEATLLASVLETLLLISPFFFWGTAMVAMKGVLPKAGPMFVAATRLIPAGALLVGFASSRGRKMPAGAPAWLTILLFGLIDASCFQGFLAEGLRRTSAGLGSVIIDSQPLTVAVLAAVLFGESLGPAAIVGLGLGVVGLLLLEVPLDVLPLDVLQFRPYELQGALPPSSIGTQPAGAGDWSLWDSGEWWMLLAAQSMAIGTVMVRWVSQYSDPIMATGWHMILGGIPLLALSLWQHDPAVSGHLQDLNSSDWGALFYTSLFGSAISYGVFFYNATRGSLTKLSSLTFLTPMFAALFGYLVLDETLNGVQLVGVGVTLLAIYLVNMKVEAKAE